jgi:hypothetical protein
MSYSERNTVVIIVVEGNRGVGAVIAAIRREAAK